MESNFYDSYRPAPESQIRQQTASGSRPARPRVQTDRTLNPPLPPASGGIPPRKSSIGSNGNTRSLRDRRPSKRIPQPLNIVEEDPRPQYLESSPHQHHSGSEPTRDPSLICHHIHHQQDQTSYMNHLHSLSRLPHSTRFHRAQDIFLHDHTARPILTLGHPTHTSNDMRQLLYNGTLHSHTSHITSPRTRIRFLTRQDEVDLQTHPCFHGIDTFDLHPLTRRARQELTTGPPHRIVPHHQGLRLLQRRATLDILTPSERSALIEWWETHHGRKILSPVRRRFPWARFGERHYLQRRARQAEKDKNQRLYDMGLLSPGTAESLRGQGKLHGDYDWRERRRVGSCELERMPSRASKTTIRTC